MLIAVIIPFRGNPDILLWALEGFARQSLPSGATLDIRLCGDGTPLPANLPTPASPSIRYTTTNSLRVGISQAKNLLLQDRPCDIVIFSNADTRPIPTFVQAHVQRLLSLPKRSMVLGASLWEPSPPPANPTVFDALLADTPMVFFYNQLRPHQSCNFRHAWNLNVSVRYADLARIGFFNPLFRPYGYEDLDLACRIMGPDHAGVFYDPAAEVLHRHPMTFDDYLNREELLGIMAPVLHAANPDLFARLHGTADLAALAESFRHWMTLDRPAFAWIYRRMAEWNARPASDLGQAEARERLLMALYQMHLPLKRLGFRLGFLKGLELREDARWQERRADGLWRSFVK